MMVAGVVLAAGSSTRLGQPKQNLRLRGDADDTLLNRTVKTALAADLAPVIVVISPAGTLPTDDRAQVVVNHHAVEGMASSIRAGARAAVDAGAKGVLVLVCDQPTVTAEHLRTLIRESAQCTRVVASSYAGRKGVPACFPASGLEKLLNLRGDKGARALISQAHSVALKGGDLDIDTLRDLEAARELYSRHPDYQ